MSTSHVLSVLCIIKQRKNFAFFIFGNLWCVHYKWVPVTTAWYVLRLWMEEWPPIWRVAVYILNKQLWTADKGWSSSLGLGQVVTIPHHKNWPCYEMDMCLWAGLVLWHDLSNGRGT